ncbi:hypothetical protein GCM10011504_35840 [Siccirubricoccus deserti]|nr:hypothetical protein GCM10011504_35840 [Siccirubricoccus deserti]
MHHLVDAIERAAHHRFVADIADAQLGLGIQTGRRPATGVDLFDQTVEDADTVPAPQQRMGEMATDEAGTAGDKYPFPHSASLRCCTTPMGRKTAPPAPADP